MTSFTTLVLTILLGCTIRSGDCHSTTTDCTSAFCQIELSPGLVKRYRIAVPDALLESECRDCKITIQMVLDGYSWIGVGVSRNGGMVGSHVVIGEPGMAEPKAYYLNGKARSLITRSDILLEDATIGFLNGQTIMEFTATFQSLGVESPLDNEPDGISLYGSSSFVWAHGNDGENELKYHGDTRKDTYVVNNLSRGAGMEAEAGIMAMIGTTSNTSTDWIVHGILAFISWGICAPLAIATAILRNLDDTPLLKYMESLGNKISRLLFRYDRTSDPSEAPGKNLSEKISKWWLYVHVGCNSVNYVITVAVFSIAVSTIKKEGSPNWSHKHSKMGLIIFLLATFQVVGGFLRPPIQKAHDNKLTKCHVRKVWELVHNIFGIMLFLFGVWQMYSGLILYNRRYDNSNLSSLAFVYVLWMGVWASLIIGLTVYKWKYQMNNVSVRAEGENIQISNELVDTEEDSCGGTDDIVTENENRHDTAEDESTKEPKGVFI